MAEEKLDETFSSYTFSIKKLKELKLIFLETFLHYD
jgi:hypothetical protein